MNRASRSLPCRALERAPASAAKSDSYEDDSAEDRSEHRRGDPLQRRGKVISHFWGSELLYVPPEPGQEYRHNDVLDALWNMLDLTPAGRGDFHPQLGYPSFNPKGNMT